MIKRTLDSGKHSTDFLVEPEYMFRYPHNNVLVLHMAYSQLSETGLRNSFSTDSNVSLIFFPQMGPLEKCCEETSTYSDGENTYDGLD